MLNLIFFLKVNQRLLQSFFQVENSEESTTLEIFKVFLKKSENNSSNLETVLSG
jgi:bacterioferritin (cytochrome b1)